MTEQAGWDARERGSTTPVWRADGAPAARPRTPRRVGGPVPVEQRPRRSALPVEDDGHQGRGLVLALARAGYEVRDAGATAKARLRLVEREPETIRLDLTLADGGGPGLSADLGTPSNPVMIIVADHADSTAVVLVLEAGVDGDVRTPGVGSSGPSARLGALLRHGEPAEPARSLSTGSLVIDLCHGTVTRAGVDVPLTPTERRLLRELTAHAGHVVTRSELLERVWAYPDIGDTRLLDVHIRRLRIKLEQDSSAPQYIATVRGLGYRFNG